MSWADSATGGSYGGGSSRSSNGGGFDPRDTPGPNNARDGRRGATMGPGGGVGKYSLGRQSAGGGAASNRQVAGLPVEQSPANEYLERFSSDIGLIDPSQAFQGDQGASDLFGQLNRAQWQDWKQRFAPYVERLADRAQDPYAPQQTATDARNAMGIAFDNNVQTQQMQNQGYGINMTPAQQQAQERRNGVQRSASMVSAGNQARISEQDRQQAILAGGMGLSNIPDRVMNS